MVCGRDAEYRIHIDSTGTSVSGTLRCCFVHAVEWHGRLTDGSRRSELTFAVVPPLSRAARTVAADSLERSGTLAAFTAALSQVWDKVLLRAIQDYRDTLQAFGEQCNTVCPDLAERIAAELAQLETEAERRGLIKAKPQHQAQAAAPVAAPAAKEKTLREIIWHNDPVMQRYIDLNLI